MERHRADEGTAEGRAREEQRLRASCTPQLKAFRKRLARAMGRRGLTAAELADRCGFPRSTVSRYLSGQRYPNPCQLIALSRCLQVPTDWLLGFSTVEIEQHFRW